MNSNLFNVGHDCVRFFVLVLLTEAEDEVEREQGLDGQVYRVRHHGVGYTEGSIVSLYHRVFARHNEHDDVEGALPVAVFRDHEPVEEVAFFLAALAVSFDLTVLLVDAVACDLTEEHLLLGELFLLLPELH